MDTALENRIARDDYGYMLDAAAWSPAIADRMAAEDGVTLTPAHWEIVNLIRGYYDEHGIVPALRLLSRAIGLRLGRDKGTAAYLYDLFPDGAGSQAVRYAGLPRPTGCTKR